LSVLCLERNWNKQTHVRMCLHLRLYRMKDARDELALCSKATLDLFCSEILQCYLCTSPSSQRLEQLDSVIRRQNQTPAAFVYDSYICAAAMTPRCGWKRSENGNSSHVMQGTPTVDPTDIQHPTLQLPEYLNSASPHSFVTGCHVLC